MLSSFSMDELNKLKWILELHIFALEEVHSVIWKVADNMQNNCHYGAARIGGQECSYLFRTCNERCKAERAISERSIAWQDWYLGRQTISISLRPESTDMIAAPQSAIHGLLLTSKVRLLSPRV